MFGKNFDGDDAVQPCVLGAVDLAHASFPNGRKDLVGAQSSRGRKRHCRRVVYLNRQSREQWHLIKSILAKSECFSLPKLYRQPYHPPNRQRITWGFIDRYRVSEQTALLETLNVVFTKLSHSSSTHCPETSGSAPIPCAMCAEEATARS